jgi:hypothetical protein
MLCVVISNAWFVPNAVIVPDEFGRDPIGKVRRNMVEEARLELPDEREDLEIRYC